MATRQLIVILKISNVSKTDAKKRFQFLELPPELRMKVYEYTLEGNKVKIRLYYNKKAEMRIFGSFAPSILLANKQIYNEAITTFYRTATFSFKDAYNGRRWLQGLPEKFRSEIKAIHLDEDVGYDDEDGVETYLNHELEHLLGKLAAKGISIQSGTLKASSPCHGGGMVWVEYQERRCR